MANTKITTNVIADDAVTSDKLGGDLTMPGHVSLADNKELRIGTGNDLVIKHDATDTIFTNTTGNLVLAGSHVYIANAANNEYMGLFIADGAASLRFNNVEELATVSGGVYIPNELGIGTNSPTQKLEILGSSSTLDIGADDTAEVVAQFVPNSTNNRNGQLRIAGTTSPHNHSIALISDSSTNVGMAFVTTSSGTRAERMVIGSTGEVGIGTTSPVHDLHIHKTATGSQARIQLTNGNTGASNADGYALAMETDGRVYHWLYENAYMQFATNNLERMRITAAGNVGMGGYTDPKTKLHIGPLSSGDGSAQERLRISGDYTATGSGTLIRFTNQHNSGTNPNSGEYNVAGIKAFDYRSDWGGAIALQTAPNTSTGGNLTDRLVINPEGLVTMPSQPVAIYHYSNSNQDGAYGYSWPGTGAQNIICRPQVATLNRGSMYNASNGRFTAPVAGIYRYAVHGNLYTNNLNASAYYFMQVLKNAAHYIYFYEANSINNANGWVLINVSGIISMAKDDYIQWRLQTNNLTTSGVNGFGFDLSQYTHFEFQLLY